MDNKLEATSQKASFPKLHNAMWPGVVGKGEAGTEPAIALEDLLKLTAASSVNGVGFDGVDLFLDEPHVAVQSDPDIAAKLTDQIGGYGLAVGSCVAPVWSGTGNGSPLADKAGRDAFLEAVRKACALAAQMRQTGIRTDGVVRIDSATSVEAWLKDPITTSRTIINTFKEASIIAEYFGERLAIEGEICWGGMHSWKYCLDVLEAVDRPQWLGFQADMAHTSLFAMGFNAPEHALITPEQAYKGSQYFHDALVTLTDALRPWTIDFHVAQNDGSVKGSGSHDKTGRHCLPYDGAGLLNIPKHAGLWLRDNDGQLTKSSRHICWDGCMFSNEILHQQDTWNSVLSSMIDVRAAHGWWE